MIAIGTLFVNLLVDKRLSMNQYLIMYCFVYNKVDSLKQYYEEFPFPFGEVVKLQKRGYIDIDTEYFQWWDSIRPTFKCIKFIKDLVDSYTDTKAENPFADDEDLKELANGIYEGEFKEFFSIYPRHIVRIDGKRASLKEGKKEIKKLYISALRTKKISASEMKKYLEYYLREKKTSGNVMYIKTLKNWLAQEIYIDTKEEMNHKDTNKKIDYGGSIK